MNQKEVLKKYRDKIYNTCNLINTDANIFELKAPTGAGKTLSALKLADRLQKDRIIYVLPFISITTQVAKVCKKKYKKDVTEVHSASKERLLLNYNVLEPWENKVIVMTSVEFMESLHSAHSGRCAKLPFFINSVIILDEFQTLPLKLLQPIANTIEALCKDYNCKIIFSSATFSPFIDRIKSIPKIQITEPFINEMYKDLYSIEPEVISCNIDQLINNIKEKYKLNKRICCILNVKKAAEKVFRALKVKSKYLLYGNMCQKHKENVIKKISNPNKECVLICTQVIEAGVDIDFPVLYRVICPLDSLIQSAGRCNRERSEVKGKFYIVDLKEENDDYIKKWYPDNIYKENSNRTRNLVYEYINSIDDLFIIPQIYTDYKKYTEINKDTGGKFKDMSDNLSIRDINDEFEMIPDNTRPVLVAYRKEGRSLLNRLLMLPEGSRIPKSFYYQMSQYTVNVYPDNYNVFSVHLGIMYADNINVSYNNRFGLQYKGKYEPIEKEGIFLC